MPFTAEKQIHVDYFAILKEQRGKDSEVIQTSAATAQELYSELKERFGFSLAQNHLSVAVNDEFAKWDTPLKENDRVVFIPPVAGG